MGKYNTRGANKRMQRNVVAMKENLQSVAGLDDEIPTSKETNKKRKVTKTSVESEKETKRIKRTKNFHDNYCWKCHRIESGIECSPEIECFTCLRSFHPSCIKSAKIDKYKSCYVCQQQSNAKATSNIDDEIHLSELLLHIIDTACPMDSEEYKLIVEWPDSEENEKLICKKDLRLIRDRCIQRGIQYESHVELVDDIEWIHHNCIIIYGEKSSAAKITKKTLLEVQRMLKDALDCPECYYKKIRNEPYVFLNICSTPHPLVWAKVKGWSYWPAKCLKVSNGKAQVRFFHTHQIASVPLSNVLAMSEKCPSGSSKTLDKKSKNGVDFVMAMSELEAYVGIFKDQYGKFPYAAINTPFDFGKEDKILKDLFENHSRTTIVEEHPFLTSSDNEPRNYPVVVDLTDDASETDEDQMCEAVASSVPETHETGDLYEQDIPITTADDAGEDYLAGFQDSIEHVLQGDPKEFQSIHQAISDSLAPSHNSESSEDHNNLHWLGQRIPSPAGISISNIISGTDIPSGSDLLAEVAHCEAEPVLQNTNFDIPSADPFQCSSDFPSSNNTQFSLKNLNKIAEDADTISNDAKTRVTQADIAPLLQAIIMMNNQAGLTRKRVNYLFQKLICQYWGIPSTIMNLEKKIRNLKQEIEDLKEQNSSLKSDLLNEKDKISNADSVVKHMVKQRNNYGKENEELRKKIEMLKGDIEKQAQEFRKHMGKSEDRFKERLKEAKTKKYCDNIDCFEPAKILCCYSGIKSYAYCNEKCKTKDDVHKKLICKAVKRNIQQPEEIEPNPEQVVAAEVVQQSTTTIIYSIQSQSNKEINTASPSPQTSSNVHTMNKVVAAKQTFEVARNINRNQNSSDIY